MKTHHFFLRTVGLSFVFGLLIFFVSGCKKEKETWMWCSDCTIETITGAYKGKASHLKYLNDSTYQETTDKDVYANLNSENSQLTVEIGIVNLFHMNFSGAYNNQYYIELPGSGGQFSAKILRHGEKIKLVGIAKKFHENHGVTETAELIDFEIYKE
ncbi:MAG: hypothetical protein H3C41_02610 [Bacteroidales bacterium]|nr:hypothetical protein [Bacteroidales bacterium]